MKAEIAFLKGESGEETTLSEEDQATLAATVADWVRSPEDAPLNIGALTVRLKVTAHARFLSHRVCVAPLVVTLRGRWAVTPTRSRARVQLAHLLQCPHSCLSSFVLVLIRACQSTQLVHVLL